MIPVEHRHSVQGASTKRITYKFFTMPLLINGDRQTITSVSLMEEVLSTPTAGTELYRRGTEIFISITCNMQIGVDTNHQSIVSLHISVLFTASSDAHIMTYVVHMRSYHGRRARPHEW